MTSGHETGCSGCRSWPSVLRGERETHSQDLWQWHEYSISHWCLCTHRLSTQTSQWTWLLAFWRLKGLADLFEACCGISSTQLFGQTHTPSIKVSNLYSKKAGQYRFWISTRHQTVRVWVSSSVVVKALSFRCSVWCKIFSSVRFAVSGDRMWGEVQLYLKSTTLFIVQNINWGISPLHYLITVLMKTEVKVTVMFCSLYNVKLSAAALQRPETATAPPTQNWETVQNYQEKFSVDVTGCALKPPIQYLIHIYIL